MDELSARNLAAPPSEGDVGAFLDGLRARVRDLANRPSAEAADAFVAELCAAPPGADLAAFITATLELPALHQVRDSRGQTLRWHLVDRLLGSGFPHALHVSPDDLDYHREGMRSGGAIPAALTTVSAVLSLLWSGTLAGAAVLSGVGTLDVGLALGMVGLTLATVHAALALVASVHVWRGRPSPMMGWLGAAFFIGPIICALVAATRLGGAPIAAVVGAPAMLTGLLCALTAVRMKAPIQMGR